MEDAEQKKADEGIDFEFSQMEEDDIDLLEPSQNEDMNTFVANDDGTDDFVESANLSIATKARLKRIRGVR